MTHSKHLPTEVIAAPDDLRTEHAAVITKDSIRFLTELVRDFDSRVDKLLHKRNCITNATKETGSLPKFPDSKERKDGSWKISPVPKRLKNCKLTVGDVSPARTDRFENTLTMDCQAVQVDFDDGHCPTWRNQIIGWYNIYRAARGQVPHVQDISKAPLMMIRPRGWNMVDHAFLVDGREAPGALVDFAMVTYHNAKHLLAAESGPFFFLPKIEHASECDLWEDIFSWTEKKLTLPEGTIRASVQIESILAAFEMEEILYALRKHSAGLNAGIWDYSASIIGKFGYRKDCIIPDRRNYVDISRPYLKNYMDLLVQTCHKRGAPATSGMAALKVPDGQPEEWESIINEICKAKSLEIAAGFDGFLFYDINLLRHLISLWQEKCPVAQNQMDVLRKDVDVTESDLMTFPQGGVSRAGLTENVAIAILFIQSWLNGEGVFSFNGRIEDSATAEISRSQVWQWIRHGVKLENDQTPVTRDMVFRIADLFVQDVNSDQYQEDDEEWQEQVSEIANAAVLYKQLVTTREFPEFITTFLNQDSSFVSKYH